MQSFCGLGWDFFRPACLIVAADLRPVLIMLAVLGFAANHLICFSSGRDCAAKLGNNKREDIMKAS